MKLERYLNIKFGNNDKSLKCILYMLRRSLGASSFTLFWRNWNPLWSYFLLYYVYKPLSSLINKKLANFLTFVISGFLHDCVAMLLMLKPSYVMTSTFTLFAVLIVIENRFNINLRQASELTRATYQLTALTITILPVLIFFRLI